MKNSAKYCTHKRSSEPVWETLNRPPNIKCVPFAFYAHTDPFAKEIGDGRYFGIGRLITPIKNLSLNLRNFKYKAFDALTYSPIKGYHSHAALI